MVEPAGTSPEESIAERAPLRDEVVLDFTHVIAGPMCTMLLGDVGAQVIKVEPPTGDRLRERGAIKTVADGRSISAFVAAFNRRKSSIVLDIKTEAGLQIAKDLASKATIVVENFAPGVLSRLGLDLAELRRENPALITASITLQGGDAAAKGITTRGLAIAAEAESGIATTTPAHLEGPVEFGFPLGDHAAAQEAYAGIVTAIVERERSGKGSHVDISMVAALVRYNSSAISTYSMSGARKPEVGNAVWGYYKTRDSAVAIGLSTNDQWARFLSAMGRDDLQDDPRFTSYKERGIQKEPITEIINAWSTSCTTAEAMQALDQAGLPCGDAKTVEEIVDDTSNRLDLLITVDDGCGGTIQVPASPFGTIKSSLPVPRLGQHTSQVMHTYLGLDDDQVNALMHQGAFGPSWKPEAG